MAYLPCLKGFIKITGGLKVPHIARMDFEVWTLRLDCFQNTNKQFMLAITSILSVHVGAGGKNFPRHLAVATSAAGNVMVVTF